MESKTYGVKSKASAKFFAGFDAKTQEPIWSTEADAVRMTREAASQQALLFVCYGINVQRKPEALQ